MFSKYNNKNIKLSYSCNQNIFITLEKEYIYKCM